MSNIPDHYSYSRLEQVDTCPYSYYLEKIEEVECVENGFSQLGSLYHDLLDKWAKGELKKEHLANEFRRRFRSEVTRPWPRMLAAKGYNEKALQQGVDYFENFDGFPGYKILAAEEEFETEIGGRKFIGFIDMILEKEDTGELVILDHKSKSLSAFRKAQDEMYKQQLLYAKHVHEKYGRYPDILMFNLFKEGGMLMSRPFDLTQYADAMVWAAEQIEKIEKNDFFDWLKTKDSDFFCTEICSCRLHCPNGTYKK